MNTSGKEIFLSRKKNDNYVKASTIIDEIVLDRLSMIEKWEKENEETARLLIECCCLSLEKKIDMKSVFDKFKKEFGGPPGSYTTIKRFVNARMREEDRL